MAWRRHPDNRLAPTSRKRATHDAAPAPTCPAATGIKRAYDNTCAISGLRIINGGGRAEAQAAHIRPVHANGPDSLRNGVALSSTWNPDGRLRVPEQEIYRPHRRFLEHHRAEVFKG